MKNGIFSHTKLFNWWLKYFKIPVSTIIIILGSVDTLLYIKRYICLAVAQIFK
jgi:hypothetical protein